MGHVQKLSTFLFVLALALLWGGSVRAASFSASLSVEEGRPGTQVEARFFYNGTLSGVAALRIRLEYDPEVLRFQEVQYGDQLEKGEAATKNEDGVLSTVVTLPGEETSLDIGDLLVCSFLVRGDAPLEKTLLRASVFQVVDGNSEPVQEGMETELALQVLPPPSTDARLLSLVPETGQLTPAFHPEVLEYRLSVPFEVTSMTFAAQPATGASCRVNRESLGAGGSDTLFRITVTAEDGETQRVYQVTVHRQEKEEEPELSQDTRLLSLLPETGELVPEFEPGILEYSLTVPYEVTAMTFSAQPAEGASCRVNRKNLGAGGSATLFLLTVTAEDGESKRVYQVTVHRQEKEEEEKPTLSQDARLLSLTPEQGQLSPAFDPEVLEYRLTVPFEVTTMTFAAQPAEGASYRVNRKNLGAGGSSTLFTLTVTAEDGTAKRVYQVTVYRQEKAAAASPSPTRTPPPVSVGSAGTSRPSSSSTAGPAREETPAPVQSAPAEEASAAPALEPVPVIEEEGGTPSPSSTEGGSGGLILQSGRTTSLLPGLLAGALFLLVCFLSGPIARWVNRHFPASGKEPPQQRK
ncbi:MAG: cadherin-like beta sandwich domain-containing protein [Acutalibacter sp.]